MCKFIWEWIYAKQIAPRDTRGALGGLSGPTIQQSGEAVRLVPTLIHVCGFICERTYAKYKSPHNTPGGISGVGGYRVSQIQKSREAVKRLDRLATNLAHICRSIWEWIYDKQIAPRDTRGTWVGLGVKHSKVLGSCQTAGPIGTNFGSRLLIHLGMDTG